MTRAQALEKIRKCLALAKSNNPHEAAAALRQAQKLMAAYEVDENDVELAAVRATKARAGRDVNIPPRWHVMLLELVDQAFGVRCIWSPGRRWSGRAFVIQADVEIVGIGARAEVASYAYVVLRRRVQRDRADFLASLDRRLKRSTKTRRADIFAESWVDGVQAMVTAFAVPEAEQALVERWMAGRGLVKFNARNPGGRPSRADLEAALDGRAAGRSVQLRHGMGKAAERERIARA